MQLSRFSKILLMSLKAKAIGVVWFPCRFYLIYLVFHLFLSVLNAKSFQFRILYVLNGSISLLIILQFSRFNIFFGSTHKVVVHMWNHLNLLGVACDSSHSIYANTTTTTTSTAVTNRLILMMFFIGIFQIMKEWIVSMTIRGGYGVSLRWKGPSCVVSLNMISCNFTLIGF